MLAKRIIPCLDVKDGKVVKGVRFGGHQIVGDPVGLALKYSDDGADELVFYDISASPEGRTVDLSWVSAVGRTVNIPFTVAGGIRSVTDALACLEAGADKISINSPALLRPDLINEIADVAGSQCVVVGVDSLSDGDRYIVRMFTGDPKAEISAQRDTISWLREAEARGAGEVVLNCMNQDGVRNGYDIAQLRAANAVLSIPLIASGGAGSAAHFQEVFEETDVSGALAASIFHKGILTVPQLKENLRDHGIIIR